MREPAENGEQYRDGVYTDFRPRMKAQRHGVTNGDGIWQLRVRVADDTIALLGAEKPLREAMESWVSDPDGNISNRKVWSVAGFGDAADRPPIEMSLLAECIKGMVLKRGLA